MLIRHGEKPAQQPPPYGVDPTGQTDPHALSVVGWQRAGALVDFFSYPRGTIQQPTYLYSPPEEGGDEGGRPYETINPLSAKLGLTQNTSFSVGQETQLVPDVMTRGGAVVLIAWEHHHIPLIANAILQSTSQSPQQWPGDRFDVVWVFTPAQSGWSFSQVPELVLAGDSSSVIPMQQSAPAGGG
jgi:hypothetical protein